MTAPPLVCCVRLEPSHVFVFGLFVRVSSYPMWIMIVAVTVMHVIMFVLPVCVLRECAGGM